MTVSRGGCHRYVFTGLESTNSLAHDESRSYNKPNPSSVDISYGKCHIFMYMNAPFELPRPHC